MAATIGNSRHFNNISDLSLTAKQEGLLTEHIPMVKRVCRKYINRGYYAVHDDPIVTADDLIQIAMVCLASEIKYNTDKTSYWHYYKVVSRSCWNQLDYNKIKGNKSNHKSVDDTDNKIYLSDQRTSVDRLHARLYIKQLLDGLNGKCSKSILLHYYGIDTAPIGPKLISDLLPLCPATIAKRRWKIVNRLKSRISRGELPQWKTG